MARDTVRIHHTNICDALISTDAFGLSFRLSRCSPLNNLYLSAITSAILYSPSDLLRQKSPRRHPHSGPASSRWLFHARTFPSTESCVAWMDPPPVQVKRRSVGILHYFLCPELQFSVFNLSGQASRHIVALPQASSLFFGEP